MTEEKTSQVDELFGDDDIGGDNAAPPPRSEGGRGRGRFRLILVVVTVIIVGVFYFLSSANHEKYFINVNGDTVKVERGYFFVVGSGAWSASNPAYKPFTLPKGVTPSKTGAMSLEEVDAVLYDLYVEIAENQLEDEAAGDPDIAEEMLHRANKLSSSSIARDRKLQAMQGDVAFRRGIKEVRGIQTRFDMAVEQFQEAARRGGHVYKGSDRWVETIKRHRNELRQLSVESGLDPELVLAPALPPVLGGDAPAPEGAEAPAEGDDAVDDGAAEPKPAEQPANP